MDYLHLFAFWFGFGIAWYVRDRECKEPGYIRRKLDSLVARLK
jgi:hypothetical protein